MEETHQELWMWLRSDDWPDNPGFGFFLLFKFYKKHVMTSIIGTTSTAFTMPVVPQGALSQST